MIEVKIKNKEGVVVINRIHLGKDVLHLPNKPCNKGHILQSYGQEEFHQGKRGIFSEESFLSSLVVTKNLRKKK